MSTATGLRRRLQFWKTTEDAPHAAPSLRRPRVALRWRLAAIGLGLVLLIWLLPVVVAKTFLFRWALGMAAGDLQGTIRVESASLGWFSPVVLRGIEVRDLQDQPLAEVVEFSTGKSLLGILWNTSALGELRVQQPKLTIVSRSDGSNIEDAIAKYLEPSDKPSSSVAFSLEILDGSLSLTDRANGQTCQIDNLTLNVSMPSGATGPLYLKASAAVADRQHPGSLDAKVSLPPRNADDPSPAAGANCEVSVEAKQIPLAVLESLACRFATKMQLGGRLSSRVQVQWSDAPAGKSLVQAEVSGEELLIGTAALGSDRLRLKQARAACRIAQQPGSIRIEESSLQCDVGRLELSGTLQTGKTWTDTLLESLLHQAFDVDGQVDLAALTAMLPNTLRIREGTRITDGDVQLAVSGRQEPRGTVWHARIEASDLKAVEQNRQIAWQRPLSLVLTAANGPQGPVVEVFRCDSDFLKLQAAGSLQDLTASGAFDLQQLTDQLGQFVDLGGLQLAGNGWGRWQWKRTQQQFDLRGEIHARDFQFAAAGRKPWREPTLDLTVAALGASDLPTSSETLLAILARPKSKDSIAAKVNTRLDAAAIELRTATDQLKVTLLEPVAELKSDNWPLSIQGGGSLDAWLARLDNLGTVPVFAQGTVPIFAPAKMGLSPSGPGTPASSSPDQPQPRPDDFQLSGTYQIDARDVRLAIPGFDPAKMRVSLQNAKVTAGQLRVALPSINLAEPVVELTVSGTWDQSPRRLDVKTATLTSSVVAARCDDATLAMPADKPLQLGGKLSYRADIARLRQCFSNAQTPSKWQFAGQIEGGGTLQMAGTRIGAAIDADVANLLVMNAAGDRFQEPRLRLAARGDYDTQSSVVRLEQLQLSSASVSTNLAGQLTSPPTGRQLDLEGQLGYDLEKLLVLLQPYVGSGVRMAGRGNAPLAYHGPLDVDTATANAAIKWDWATAYGFNIGPAELKPVLSKGVLTLAEPLNAAVNGGRVRLAPQVRLTAEPVDLTLPAGPLVEKVNITPEMCADGLKQILPVLAGVTHAQGSFSIDLQNCRIPLSNPERGELAGRLTIHSVEVSPGPLLSALAALAGRNATGKLRHESVVPFRMANGRVYHEGLELAFSDVTIRTRGSVGFDQSVDMVADMPIQAKWLGNNPLAATLSGQSIAIPIRGTLDKPAVDMNVIDQLGRKLAPAAAQKAIETGSERLEDEVNKGLNRLFGPPK